MLDYLILSFEVSGSYQSELQNWLSTSACLGWENTERGATLDFRLYFDSGEDAHQHIQNLKQRFPSIQVHSETEIRLPETTDRVPELKETLLAGESFLLLSGPAFGSGMHPTTRLVATLLRKLDLKGRRVLDLGSGTGILALLAERLGATIIEAVEISPAARENSRANFALNTSSGISIYSSLHEAAGPYDLVLANLMTPTLLQLRNQILERLAPQGQCLVSGVMKAEKAALLQDYSQHFTLVEEIGEEDWLGFRFSLKSPSENLF